MIRGNSRSPKRRASSDLQRRGEPEGFLDSRIMHPPAVSRGFYPEPPRSEPPHIPYYNSGPSCLHTNQTRSHMAGPNEFFNIAPPYHFPLSSEPQPSPSLSYVWPHRSQDTDRNRQSFQSSGLSGVNDLEQQSQSLEFTKEGQFQEEDNFGDEDRVFLELVPAINMVTAHDYDEFLVRTVRDYSYDLSLEDLFRLLYGTESGDSSDSDLGAGGTSDKPAKRGLRLYRLIIDSFTTSKTGANYFVNKYVHNLNLSSINYHEFLRTFLAIKIISECVIESNSSKDSLPRMSVYKAYCVFCERLIHKSSEKYQTGPHFKLGHSKIGRVTRLVFPDVLSKRLGKRGNSKYHYLEVAWNPAAVDAEVLRLIDLEVSDISQHFANLRSKETGKRQSFLSSSNTLAHDVNDHTGSFKFPGSKSKSESQKPRTQSSINDLIYSYVDKRSKYPQADCSPRAWNLVPGRYPQHSASARKLIEASSDLLKEYDVDITSLVSTYMLNPLGENIGDLLSDAVANGIAQLVRRSAPTTAYLRLYFAISYLFFPMVLASDKEVAANAKSTFREHINQLIARSKTCFSSLGSVDLSHLMNFTRIWSKMIHISEMTSSGVNIALTEGVVHEMVGDIGSLAPTETELLESKATLESIYIRGIITSINAYKYDPMAECSAEKSPDKSQDMVELIQEAARLFVELTIDVQQSLLKIPENLAAEANPSRTMCDLPYRTYWFSAQYFHEICLRHVSISSLPIPVIKFVVLNITNEMQKVSFDEFAHRDREISKETFKTWWVFSVIGQEYMTVLSELTALRELLGYEETQST